MFYKKNVSLAERIVRVVLGVGLSAAGFLQYGMTTTALAFSATGALAIATGVFGFCPACALVGRRLSEGER